MAKKITVAAVNAFRAGRPFKSGNTSVELSPLGAVVVLKLHGHAIARYDRGDASLSSLEVTNAGYNTVTTRERLNALPGVSVCTRNDQAYLNGFPWEGDWTHVSQWNETRDRGPNLDAMDLQELKAFFSRYESGRLHAHLFPSKPLGASQVTRDLAAYAINAAVANAERADGRISSAERYEAICQRIYRDLPKWAQW